MKIYFYILAALTFVACKPRLQDSGLSNVSDKSGQCPFSQSLKPNVMHVRDVDSIPPNVEMFGWWDMNTIALAKAEIAKREYDIDLTKGRVMVGQTYATCCGDEIATKVGYIMIAANENLYIFTQPRGSDAVVSRRSFVIEDLVVQKALVDSESDQVEFIVGKNWEEHFTLHLEYLGSGVNKTKLDPMHQQVLDRRKQRLSSSEYKDSKVFSAGIPAHRLLPSGTKIQLSDYRGHAAFVGANEVDRILMQDKSAKSDVRREIQGGAPTNVVYGTLVFFDGNSWLDMKAREGTWAGKELARSATQGGAITANADYRRSNVRHRKQFWARTSCPTEGLMVETKTCRRMITFSTDFSRSEKVWWKENVLVQDAKLKKIYKLAYSTDTKHKLAFADGEGVHLLTWEKGSGYQIRKTIKSKRPVKILKFMAPYKAEAGVKNIDKLIIGFENRDKTIDYKMIEMKYLFEPMLIGSHGEGDSADQHWLFKSQYATLQGQKVSGVADERTKFWQTRPTSDKKAVNSVLFSPDCRSVISGGADGKVLRWDITRLNNINFEKENPALHNVAIGGQAHSGRILNLELGFDGVIGDLKSDQMKLLSAGSDGKVKVWSIPVDSVAGLTEGGGAKLITTLPKAPAAQPSFEQNEENIGSSFDLLKLADEENEAQTPGPAEGQTPTTKPDGAVTNPQTRPLVTATFTPNNDAIGISWAKQNPEFHLLEQADNGSGEGKIEYKGIDSTTAGLISGSADAGAASIVAFEHFPSVDNAYYQYRDNKERPVGYAGKDENLVRLPYIMSFISDNGYLFVSNVKDAVGIGYYKLGSAGASLKMSDRGNWLLTGDTLGEVRRYYNEDINGFKSSNVNSRCLDQNSHSIRAGDQSANLGSYKGHVGPVTGIELFARTLTTGAKPDQENIDGMLSVGWDGALRIWQLIPDCDDLNPENHKVSDSIAVLSSDYSLTSIDVSNDYNYAVTGTLEGAVLLWWVGTEIDLSEDDEL